MWWLPAQPLEARKAGDDNEEDASSERARRTDEHVHTNRTHTLYTHTCARAREVGGSVWSVANRPRGRRWSERLRAPHEEVWSTLSLQILACSYHAEEGVEGDLHQRAVNNPGNRHSEHSAAHARQRQASLLAQSHASLGPQKVVYQSV